MVNNVESRRAEILPSPSRLARVVGKHGRTLHVALFESHTVAVFDVDCRDDQHDD